MRVVDALLALVCCCLLATGARAQYVSPTILANKTTALHLGMILPLNWPNANTIYYGHPGGLAFTQAIDDINARSDILPNHRIVGWYNNSAGDMGTAVAAVTELIGKRGIHALIGDFTSDPSQVASFVCKLTSLPQISPNALASVFDSKTAYPTFFRGIGSIVTAARSLARVVRQFGYSRLAVIATTATVDQTTVQAFQAEANVLGLQIVTSQIITTGTCDAMSYQMAQLKASKMRVFGLFGLVGDARCIATAASAAGIWYRLVVPDYDCVRLRLY
jgi:ABC-type branched-subunit amino acid transport system substrate-binding protein